MSATNRGSARRARDYYPTPAYCVRRLFDRLRGASRVYASPCAGSGAINEASGVPLWDWVLGDIEPQAPYIPRRDYRETLDLARARGAFVVENPPYSIADDVILACLDRGLEFALFLRQSWFGGQARADRYLRKHPPSALWAIAERPSFTGDGRTDAANYGWFVWSPRFSGLAVLDATPKDER